MLKNPHCAVCEQRTWDELEVREYSEGNVPQDSYGQVRHDVLFKLWFRDESKVQLTPILCRTCGFLCYKPRPEALDIDQKYDYIAEHEQASQEFTVDKKSDVPRSRELFQSVKKHLRKHPSLILDYGGGNGRLLHYFVEAGHDCSTLELVDQTLPGIKYAGSRPADLAGLKAFDALICSHVLEHLADPLEMLIALIPHVQQDGFVYVEVPSEIWRRPPPSIDPVTHINFFTTDSLRALLETAGLDIISCKYQSFTRPNSMTGIAVKAIGKRRHSDDAKNIALPGPDMAYSQLGPHARQWIERLMLNPRILLNMFHKK
jgi:hypothetical protein